MNLQQLELVLAISDSGSVHGACKVLRKTQPTLTKALKQFEEELGTAIFIRSSRGMTPTELGLTIISRARVICAETRKLKEDISQILGSVNGTVSVCVSPVIAYAMMSSVLKQFRHSWPDIEINLNEAVYPESLNRLREGKVDIAVGPRPGGPNREFVEEKLFSSELVGVTRSSSPYAGAVTLEELAEAPWVVMSSQKGPGRLYEAMFITNGVSPPKRVTFIDSLVAILEFIRKTDCCCLFPRLLLDRLQGRDDFSQLAVFDQTTEVDICMFTKPDTPLTPAAEEMARIIRLHGINFVD